MRILSFFVILLLITVMQPINAMDDSNYEEIAGRIVSSLKLEPGERVLIRFDPAYMQQLVIPLRRLIRSAGAVDVGAMEYMDRTLLSVPDDKSANRALSLSQSQAFSQLLDGIDVYLWLAVSKERDLYPAEQEALRSWLKKGARRRQIHFHWGSGSMLPDGLPGEHSPEFDRMYWDAIQIDYEALSAAQDKAIKILRSGNVRVRTPAGTDLKFQTGNRPFNKQNGDASPQRALSAKVLVDREIEFPAGVLRVAPLETTVQGTLVIPQARFGNSQVRNLRMEFENGHIVKMDAEENLFEVEAQMAEVGDVAKRFREFALGLNPRLTRIPGSDIIPYYGYGAGTIRLALGDNSEIGGVVTGGFVRWFFFADATVEVNGRVLVDKGQLLDIN